MGQDTNYTLLFPLCLAALWLYGNDFLVAGMTHNLWDKDSTNFTLAAPLLTTTNSRNAALA